MNGFGVCQVYIFSDKKILIGIFGNNYFHLKEKNEKFFERKNSHTFKMEYFHLLQSCFIKSLFIVAIRRSLKEMVSIFVKGDGGIIQIFPDSHATVNSSKEIKLIFSYWKSKSEVRWIHYWKMARFCMFKLNTTCVFIGKFSSWLQKNM